jgi:hypothetical protein
MTKFSTAHEAFVIEKTYNVPVLLGSGKRTMGGLSERLELKLTDTYVYGSGVVLHYYSPARTPT